MLLLIHLILVVVICCGPRLVVHFEYFCVTHLLCSGVAAFLIRQQGPQLEGWQALLEVDIVDGLIK